MEWDEIWGAYFVLKIYNFQDFYMSNFQILTLYVKLLGIPYEIVGTCKGKFVQLKERTWVKLSSNIQLFSRIKNSTYELDKDPDGRDINNVSRQEGETGSHLSEAQNAKIIRRTNSVTDLNNNEMMTTGI